jgi:hypothetical protein
MNFSSIDAETVFFLFQLVTEKLPATESFTLMSPEKRGSEDLMQQFLDNLSTIKIDVTKPVDLFFLSSGPTAVTELYILMILMQFNIKINAVHFVDTVFADSVVREELVYQHVILASELEENKVCG